MLRIHRDIRRGAVTLILAAGAVLVGASPAEAGMPSVNLILTELGKRRAEELSFFLVVFLLSAWGVQGLWNFLRRDFPRLPRLSYRGAVAAVLLWGLAMVVVLTMISGAGADDAGGLRAERHHAQAEARRSRRGRHTGA